MALQKSTLQTPLLSIFQSAQGGSKMQAQVAKELATAIETPTSKPPPSPPALPPGLARAACLKKHPCRLSRHKTATRARLARLNPVYAGLCATLRRFAKRKHSESAGGRVQNLGR